MGESRFLAVGLALALCAVPAGARAADEPLELAPSSAWVMDYAEDSCALRRAFRADEDEVLLQLRSHGPGDYFQVTVSSATLEARDEQPKVRFDPDEGFTEPPGAFYFDEKTSEGLVYSDSLYPNALKRQPRAFDADWPEPERVARERAVTSLTIGDGFSRPVVLKTGAMHAPMNAMRACLDELLGHWGLDPAVQRTLSRRAKALDPEEWVTRIQRAYPTEMLRKRRSGIAAIRLVIGVDGRPTSCIPNKDAPDRAFDEYACEATMRYARFEPALDANGQPTPSFWTTRIVYWIG
jgi:hypothetical protein